MCAKLVAVVDLLEAITPQDFDGVASHANQLKLISLDPKWQVLQTLEYRRYGEVFRRDTDNLSTAGKQKKLDGVSLQGNRILTSCGECF